MNWRSSSRLWSGMTACAFFGLASVRPPGCLRRGSRLRSLLNELSHKSGILHRVHDLLRHIRRFFAFRGHAPRHKIDLGILHVGDRFHGLRHVRLTGRATHPAHLKQMSHRSTSIFISYRIERIVISEPPSWLRIRASPPSGNASAGQTSRPAPRCRSPRSGRRRAAPYPGADSRRSCLCG